MEIQLTRTKTITIGGGAKSAGTGPVDVVGVCLYSGDPRGCPAVRVVQKKGALKVVAAGFVPPPSAALPTTAAEAASVCTWSLPRAFQAPHAALAVSVPGMVYAQITTDARVKAALKGEPTVEEGRRVLRRPLKATGLAMESSLNEFTAAYLAKLLPEGRRPTTSAIIPRPSALIGSLAHEKAIRGSKAGTLAVFFDGEAVYIAGYAEGRLALWRQCRGVPGRSQLCELVAGQCQLDAAGLEAALKDAREEAVAALKLALSPLMAELAISADYLTGRLGLKLKVAYVLGLGVGDKALAKMVGERLGVETRTLAELELPAGKADCRDFALLAAYGAAVNAIANRDNLLKAEELKSSSPVRLRVMAPVLAAFAVVAMLVWWGMLWIQASTVSMSVGVVQGEIDSRAAAYRSVSGDMNETQELERQLDQLSRFRKARRTWAPALTALAQVTGRDVQLTKVEIPPPPPQDLSSPDPKLPPLWGPTNDTDAVSLVIAGRVFREAQVADFLKALEANGLGGAVRIDRSENSADPSPKMHHFHQEVVTEFTSEKIAKDLRMLTFEVEYRAAPREFRP